VRRLHHGCYCRRLIGLAGVALVGLAGCGKLGFGQDEMSWARAALERNDRIEVIAADPQTSTFTVRLKGTGELRMVRADQIIASPPWVRADHLAAAASAPAGTEAAPAEGQSAAAAPATASAQMEGPASNDNTLAAPGELAHAAPDERAALAAPAAAAPDQAIASDITFDAPGGRVLKSGPGYTIKAASGAAPAVVRTATEASTTSAALERRHEPIICQGDRLMQIDNRNLQFDGDAVAAQDGCEMHITNSHITAKGVGVSASAANVHIENSQIEGDLASIDASNGGHIYAESSKFKGMSRRLDTSVVHDLGGNVWN
jgi:hypothetical protein